MAAEPRYFSSVLDKEEFTYIFILCLLTWKIWSLNSKLKDGMAYMFAFIVNQCPLSFKSHHHTFLQRRFSLHIFGFSSWQIPKFLPHKKDELKGDAEMEADKKDCCSVDEKDSKVEGEEELYPHMTVTWDPPRRLVNR